MRRWGWLVASRSAEQTSYPDAGLLTKRNKSCTIGTTCLEEAEKAKEMSSRRVNDLVDRLVAALPRCPVQGAWRADAPGILLPVDGAARSSRGVDSIRVVPWPSSGLRGEP